ncbi:hypothetical protein EVAR_35636_1 [Eumeta japonica]|uniref:Uncharacterized protein n=1 Tax=Eumeta variegata TaxID=151549 RepID=A0A4C1WFU2_EUMVA|nr:hypothetical protein EVAR_35636_1 [Eumeta japonica]
MSYPHTRVRGVCPTFRGQKTPEATCWLSVVRSPNKLELWGLRLSRPIGMGCRRRVIALWMSQSGHLGIEITWRFRSGLISSRVPGARGRTGWMVMGVSAHRLLSCLC